jgi:hypothetical protein
LPKALLHQRVSANRIACSTLLCVPGNNDFYAADIAQTPENMSIYATFSSKVVQRAQPRHGGSGE